MQSHESKSASRNCEIHLAQETSTNLSATFDSGNNLVSPVGALVKMLVGNALAHICTLLGVARNRELLMPPLCKMNALRFQ